jgi:hypothetical protein
MQNDHSDDCCCDVCDPPRPKYWLCQECGYEDHRKPMPPDREKFYKRVVEHESPKCPRCKSIGYMPVGF